MRNGAPKHGQPNLRALRSELLDADDSKIMRIAEVLDEAADPSLNQTILDPVRARLALLKPSRPLRFTRLLFIPLNPLIVPARDWRPEEATVPRTALTSISNTVRAGLENERIPIDKVISVRKAGTTQMISLAGEVLWTPAAEILATAPPPVDWAETGLHPSAYPPLARAIAAVLRRAPQLRCLVRDAEIGALESNADILNDLLRDIGDESPEGCDMIARLILVQSPHMAPLLRRSVSSTQDLAEKAMLHQAVDRGVEHLLTDMENGTGFTEAIERGALAHVGGEVRRIAALLREIGHDASAAKHRPRLKPIMERLDQACRARFADGIRDGLITPLALASTPLDGVDQTRLETTARNLRTLETAARLVGSPASYDALLQRAAETVCAAAADGTLSSVRTIRLVEILSGSEAAEALYMKEQARKPVSRAPSQTP